MPHLIWPTPCSLWQPYRNVTDYQPDTIYKKVRIRVYSKRICITHNIADCCNHRTPPFNWSKALNRAELFQTSSFSASEMSMAWAFLHNWCDRPFNYLIQITGHRRAKSTHSYLLIICPAPVHTSIHQVRVSDRLLVPLVRPWFILTFSLYPLLSVTPTFHTRSPLVAPAPISFSISTSLFISAPRSPYLCMWVCCCSFLLLASLLLPLSFCIYFLFFLSSSILVHFKLDIIFVVPTTISSSSVMTLFSPKLS